MPEAKTMSTEARSSDSDVRDRIIHQLRVYPVISPTMLQAGLGPYMKARMWRSHLEDLKSEGVIIQDEITSRAPTGRYNTYRRLYLRENVDLIVTMDARSNL